VREGAAPAYRDLGEHVTWTYAELREQVDRIAHVLRMDMGLVPGNRVLLRGANCPMMAAAILAVLKAGCVAVPTMPLLRARELGIIIDKAQVNAVLCARAAARRNGSGAQQGPRSFAGSTTRRRDSLEARMARARHPASPPVDTAADDVCLISFTSGTTGVPKGTMHFHRDILAICDCFPRHTLRSESTTSSSARRRWPLPSALAACCCSRCAPAPPRCCWKS
jgi:2-aminobenzoate-CoA ligase